VNDLERHSKTAVFDRAYYHRQHGSAALFKAHSKINRKMKNSTNCKIITPEIFILKLGKRDYVEDVTYYIIFDVDRFSGGFSPNR